MKLTHSCPQCSRPAKIQAEFPLGNLINYVYQCGHVELRSKIQVETSIAVDVMPAPPEPTYKELYADLDAWICDGGAYKKGEHEQPKIPPYIHFSFWAKAICEPYYCDECEITHIQKHAYKFQRKGIEFIEKTQINALDADAMGLGKTVQALLVLKRNAKITYPALIIVKGATLFQWAHEYQEWVNNFTSCMPILDRMHIVPGFESYIISMDMLARKGVQEKLLALKLKTVVIDEVQNFKDPNAKRTKALIELIQLGNIEYKLALSGTPIKNKVTEYGPILNILAPRYFTESTLDKKWLHYDGKRLNPYKADEFKDLISHWVIRRERHEVLKNLPPLTRDYQIIEITDPAIKNSYNSTVDLFKNYLNSDSTKTGIKATELLGWLARLRAITGQAKCQNALEWTRDFLESTDESLAIGVHHTSVRDTLYYVLDSLKEKVLKYSGEDSSYTKNSIVQRFTNGEARVLVINMIAGGLGLNLQSCANTLIIERPWNPSDEDQFIARFHRNGQKLAVTATIMIAKGTIDEFFHALMSAKTKLVHEAGIKIGDIDVANDLNFLKELSNYVVNSRI